MEFVGKAISDQLNGIRGQGHFGPTLMEFVGKAISDHFGPRVWALGFRTKLNGIRRVWPFRTKG